MDLISEERLAEVHPELARRVRFLAGILLADTPNVEIRVTQGFRTWVQQDALYQQGRTTPGKIVTDARSGYSAHNFGLAVDVAPFLQDGQPDWKIGDENWKVLLAKALTCKLAEGAQWRTFPDNPHLYCVEVPADPDDNMRYLFTEGGLPAVWQEFQLSADPLPVVPAPTVTPQP